MNLGDKGGPNETHKEDSAVLWIKGCSGLDLGSCSVGGEKG